MSSCFTTVKIGASAASVVVVALVFQAWKSDEPISSTENGKFTTIITDMAQEIHSCEHSDCTQYNAVPQPYTILDSTNPAVVEKNLKNQNQSEDAEFKLSTSKSEVLDRSKMETIYGQHDVISNDDFLSEGTFHQQTKDMFTAQHLEKTYDASEGTKHAEKHISVSVLTTKPEGDVSQLSVRLVVPTPTLQGRPNTASTPDIISTASEIDLAQRDMYDPTSEQPASGNTIHLKTLSQSTQKKQCRDMSGKVGDSCDPVCPLGSFQLPTMESYHPWLTCDDIQKIDVLKLIAQGAVKKVYHATWNGNDVAYSVLQSEQYLEDFKHGRDMLKAFTYQPGFVQFVGSCDQTNIIITEYYPFGSLQNLNTLLNLPEYKKYNTLLYRFNLCIEYIKILHTLHFGPMGRRVMCDANDLDKLLQQFLLTDDFHILLNDMDALPSVNGKTGIICGHRQLFGEFVAPEQLWRNDRPFVSEEMTPYDEKIDIWRVPDVFEYLLQNIDDSDLLKLHLFDIHKRCKALRPEERPTAIDLLHHYISVLNSFTESENLL